MLNGLIYNYQHINKGCVNKIMMCVIYNGNYYVHFSQISLCILRT